MPLGSTSRTDVEQSGAAESGVVVPVPPPAATDAAPVAPVGSTTAGTTDVGGEPASSNPLDQLSEAHLARLGVCDGPGGGTDGGGVSFCHLNSAEAELIWEEVWVRRTYLQHGVSLRSGDTVVDVGANIGLFSLLALSYGATVVAVEPIPALAAVLEANLNRWAQSSPGGAAITEPQRGSRRGLGGRLAPAPPPPIRNYHVVQAAIGATVEDAARFSFYPEYPGESTRNPEERTAQRGRLLQELRALPLPDQGVPDEMAVLVRTELSKFDGESEDGPMVEHVLCPVRPLGAVLATCGLDEAAIDLLKVNPLGRERLPRWYPSRWGHNGTGTHCGVCKHRFRSMQRATN